MSFWNNLFGGTPTIPHASESKAIVNWFLRYDKKLRVEIDESYGEGILHVEPDLVDYLETNSSREQLTSLVARLMGQHNFMLAVLANNDQLEYALTPDAASMKLTAAKIRIFLRIAGYVLTRKHSADINDILPEYPDGMSLETEDIQTLKTKHPEIRDRLF